MTIDDIPSDVEWEMDEGLQRLFRAAGCDPACHVCHEDILPSFGFLLVSAYNDKKDEEQGKLTDQMVCARCGRYGLEAQIRERNERIDSEAVRWAAFQLEHPGKTYGHGYSRPSQVTANS